MQRIKKYEVICFLDTETTGVYWNKDAPVQLAAIICDSCGNILDKFNEKIKTTHKIAPEASKVHGIYAKDLENCRQERAVLIDFTSWLTNWEVDVIVTYNGEAFDRRMLNERCKVLKINTEYFDKERFPGIDGYYDCVQYAKKQNMFNLKELGRKWKLTLVAEKLGFSTENAHDAYADIIMLKNIFYMVDPLVHPDDWEDEKKD